MKGKKIGKHVVLFSFLFPAEMKEQMEFYAKTVKWSRAEQIRSGLELLWSTHPVFQDAQKHLRAKR